MSCTVVSASTDTMVIPRATSFESWLEGVWERPPLAQSFVPITHRGRKTGRHIEYDTQAHVVLLPQGLGFAIRCLESKPESLKILHNKNQRDRQIIKSDDSVEVFIDINHDAQQAFGIAINPQGAVLDAIYDSRDYVDKRWNSHVQPTVKIEQHQWTASFVVPFKHMGVWPGNGDTIGLGFYRMRHNNLKKANPTAWPRDNAYWSWWQRRNIPDPFFFAQVQLPTGQGSRGSSPLTFHTISRGGLAVRPRLAFNAVSGYVSNTGTLPRRFKIEMRCKSPRAKDRVYAHQGSIAPGEKYPVWLPYDWQDGDRLALRVRDLKTNREIYQMRANRATDIAVRLRTRPGKYMPQMVDRVSDRPQVVPHYTFPLHLDTRRSIRNAKINGSAFTLDSAAEEMAKTGQMPFVTIRHDLKYNNLPDRAELFRRHKMKVIYTPFPKLIAIQRDKKLSNTTYWVNASDNPNPTSHYVFYPLACDAYKQDMLASIDLGLRDYGDLIFAVVMIDELDAKIAKALRITWADPKLRNRYPLIQQIDRDIRSRFGYGRFGIAGPQTPKEDIPFCKIATTRWINQWVTQFTNEVSLHLKKLSHKVLLISDDPQGQVFPYDYANRWKNVDVVVHQTGEKAMPQDLGTAVITKFIKDLTDAKEFWPCVHIEGSLGLFDLDEMREIMSRAFRNGATGVTSYNLNWAGRIGSTEDFSAPYRWAYLNQIANFYAQGYRVKPTRRAKVAALYSSYTAMADYSRGIGYIYYVLGPGSGANFKFIDSLAMDRHEVDLTPFSVLVAYHNRYESPNVADQIIDAVRNQGKTLVVANTDSFSTGPNAQPLTQRATLLGGIQFGPLQRKTKVKVAQAVRSDFKIPSDTQIAVRQARSIDAPASATPLLVYEDGSPACVSVPLGKGRVIWFGFHPFHNITAMLDPNAPTGFDYGDKPIPDPLLVAANSSEDFFAAFLKYLQVPTDETIWSLKLPEPALRPSWKAEQICLTGNGLTWRLSRPITTMNSPMLGRYRYSVPITTDHAADAQGWIDFGVGRLTDRVMALRQSKTPEASTVVLKKPDPISIEIDLGYDTTVDHVNLYISGDWAGCQLSSSLDAEHWVDAQSNTDVLQLDGVKQVRLDLQKGTTARYLKIQLAKRSGTRPLILCELDAWGSPLSPGQE